MGSRISQRVGSNLIWKMYYEKNNLKEKWKEHDLMNTMPFTIVFPMNFHSLVIYLLKTQYTQIRHFIPSLPESFTKCHNIHSVF